MYIKSVEEGKRRIVAGIIETVIGERKVVTCRQVINENIPPFVKDSIINQARRRIRDEKPLRWNFSAHFDFDDKEIQNLFRQMMIALLMSVKFTRAELEKYIDSSISFNLNFRFNPIKTLENGLYINNEIHSKERIIRQLANINSSKSLIKQIESLIIKFEKDSVNRQDFQLLGSEAVAIIYGEENKDILIQDFKAFFELFYYNDGQLTAKGIDCELVKHFLAARGMDTRIAVVDKKKEQGKLIWRVEDIPDLFLPISVSAKYEAVGDESLAILTEKDKRKKQPSKPKIVFDSYYEDEYKVEKKIIERQPPGPYPALESLISNKEQKVFVKRIFKNDFKAYQQFIEILDGIDKWKKAKQIIDGELEYRNIDIYSKEALKLGDRVFSKFFSKSW